MRLSTALMRPLGVFLFLAGFLPLFSQAATYVYDADGRLRALTSSTGASSEYIYDALGNVYAINSVPASQLAIFAFTPNHGHAGATVTIYGQGFSTTPASNIVKFNGAAATVLSPAKATQLLVAVPAAATTGPISIQVGSATAASLENFIVTTDGGGLPPTITSFSPSVAGSGSSISVTGTNYITSVGATSAGVQPVVTAVSPTSNTQLTFVVPPTGVSGIVEVETPYGSAFSTQPLVVVPNAVGLANVTTAATKYLTIDGPSQTIDLPQANHATIAAFSGVAGQWLTLQHGATTTNPAGNYVSVDVYDPSGQRIVTGLTFYSYNALHLPQLPQDGAYLIVFYCTGASTGQIPVNLESDAIVTSSTTTITSTTDTQRKRVILYGTAGQLNALNFSAVTTAPAGHAVYVSEATEIDAPWTTMWGIYDPSVSVPSAVNLGVFPRSQPYSVTLTSDVGVTYSLTGAMVANPIGSVTTGGSSLTQNTTIPNENDYFTFNVTTGQYLSLGIGSVTTSPNIDHVYFDITAPNGQDVTGGASYCYLPGCHFALNNTQAGTYSVRVLTGSQMVTTHTMATLSTDATGTLTVNIPKTANLPRAGQIARFTFTGTAGQYRAFYLNNVSTTPAGGSVTLTVFNPDGTAVFYGGSFAASSSGLTNLLLAQTGTYVVQLETNNAATSTSQVTVVSNPTGTLVIDGASVAQSTADPNEASFLMFAGTAGQQLSLGLTNASTSDGIYYVYAYILGPNGENVGNTYVQSGTTSHLLLSPLPVTGTYTITYVPSSYVTFGVKSTLSTIQSGALTPSVPKAVSFTRAGQAGRYTFSGTPGQYVSLYLSGVSTSPAGEGVTLTPYNPDGSQYSFYSQLRTTSSGILNLSVTQSGDYTAQVEADNADTATASLVYVIDPNGALTINGSPLSESTTVPSEDAYLTFNATAGQNITLVFSSLSASPSANNLNGVVLPPAGGAIGGLSIPISTGGNFSLTNLPQTGPYTVQLYPDTAATVSFTAKVTSP
jgi:large repetitive protein